MIAQRRRPVAGFTLIEIMLALTIMTFITATLWGAFSQTARIKRRVEGAQERTHTVRVALMRMSREIEMAFLSENFNTAIQERPTMFVATPHPDVDELRFSWFGRVRMRADTPEADTSVVSYYAEPDPDERNVTNLMRRETRHLEAKDPMSIPAEAYILCPNVQQVKFKFYDPHKKEWLDVWNTMGAAGQSYLPTHVRISLTVVDEKGELATYTSSSRIEMTQSVSYRPSPS